jgi:hypothetical protein
MTCADCINLDWHALKNNRDFSRGVCRRFSSVQNKCDTACGAFLHSDLPTWQEIQTAKIEAVKKEVLTQITLNL